jgi:predicted Zn-dependent peptidase
LIIDSSISGEPRFLLDSSATTDVVAVGVWYNRGSRHESEYLSGATHLVEHMVFKGSKHHSAAALSRRMDRLGAYVNAFTERETMGLHVTVPKEGLNEACHILKEMLHESVFDVQEFHKEKQVIANELLAAEDDPEEWASEAFLRSIWPNHQLSRSIGGDRKNVLGFDPSLIYSFWSDIFKGRASLVSMAGGIQKEEVDGIKDILKFSTMDKSPLIEATPIMFNEASKYIVKNTQYVQVYVALPCVGRVENSQYYPLHVYNTILGDSMSSRLFVKLREEEGLCYSIYSSIDLFSDTTLWYIYATVDIHNLQRLLYQIDSIIKEVGAFRISKDELDDAKSHLMGSIRIASIDIEYRMRRIARQALYGTSVLDIQSSIKSIQSVEIEDIIRSVNMFFDNKPTYIVVGPSQGKRAFNSFVKNKNSF